jgi:hypothetical protein
MFPGFQEAQLETTTTKLSRPPTVIARLCASQVHVSGSRPVLTCLRAARTGKRGNHAMSQSRLSSYDEPHRPFFCLHPSNFAFLSSPFTVRPSPPSLCLPRSPFIAGSIGPLGYGRRLGMILARPRSLDPDRMSENRQPVFDSLQRSGLGRPQSGTPGWDKSKPTSREFPPTIGCCGQHTAILTPDDRLSVALRNLLFPGIPPRLGPNRTHGVCSAGNAICDLALRPRTGRPRLSPVFPMQPRKLSGA